MKYYYPMEEAAGVTLNWSLPTVKVEFVKQLLVTPKSEALPFLLRPIVTQLFEPSAELVKLVKKHMIKPNKNVYKVLTELIRLHSHNVINDSKEDDDIVKEIITNEFEGMLTSLVRRNPNNDKKIELTKNGYFTDKIASEIVER
ncbi:MAG: hypothetical protein HQK92_04810 [Nitrospirae bacterium]|nr:hypothetical protein [Nitrospirota bacterium]